jgi:hypothetical protein
MSYRGPLCRGERFNACDRGVVCDRPGEIVRSSGVADTSRPSPDYSLAWAMALLPNTRGEWHALAANTDTVEYIVRYYMFDPSDNLCPATLVLTSLVIPFQNTPSNHKMHHDTKDRFVIGANRNLPIFPGKSRGEKDDLESPNVETESLEKGTKATPTKFKKHWRRFWCCYLLGSILLLAILLPIL